MIVRIPCYFVIQASEHTLTILSIDFILYNSLDTWLLSLSIHVYKLLLANF